MIVESAHSRFAFGPETIKVYAVEKEKRTRKHIVTTRISNDGGGIRDANIRTQWLQPHIIRFCLSGVEQNDIILEINLRTNSHNEVEKPCS